MTCYQPDSSKTLFFDLNPKGAKSVYPGPTHLGPPTWAQLGPTHLGPAWAHPLGPSLGPPTWAQLGPTHLGPDAAAAGAAGAGAAGRILKSRSRPLPTHPGMKYFRKETLAVDLKKRPVRLQYLISCQLCIAGAAKDSGATSSSETVEQLKRMKRKWWCESKQ